MGSLFALPFNASEISGANQIRAQVGAATAVTATVSWTGRRYCYAQSADDLGAAVASALQTALGLTVAASWDAQGRLVLTISGTASTVYLRWTHASSTFAAAWIGHKATDDAASVTGAGSAQVITAPWQGGRLWMPESVVYAWPRPRRDVLGAVSRGRKVSTRKTDPWQVVRPFFDSVPAPRLYRSANDADLVATLMPGSDPADPNLSFEASIWEPWQDDRMPMRYTPAQTDLSTYHSLQVDPDNGGLEWLANLDEVVSPREGGEDETSRYYAMGPMPWMTEV